MLSYVVGHYDTERYPFSNTIAREVGIASPDLDQLHRIFRSQFYRDRGGFDQGSLLYKLLYRSCEPIQELYRSFLCEIIAPMFAAPIVAQRIPNLRVHRPHDLAVEHFHRDRDHGHASWEINVWLPLTRVTKTSTIWIESSEGAADYQPVMAQPGNFVVFNGADLAHGNMRNRTARSRVSLDFRVVLTRLFEDRVEVTMNTGTPFARGQYFFEDSIDPSASRF